MKEALLAFHGVLIGGIGICWATYGMQEKNMRYVVEGTILIAFVVLNTFMFVRWMNR